MTLWISEPPPAGVGEGGEQGEAGITESQTAVTHASCLKKFEGHGVAPPSMCEGCIFLCYAKVVAPYST